MSCSKQGSSDVPGYFWDPTIRRYFRIDPMNSRQCPQKSMSTGNQVASPTGDFPHILTQRQIGLNQNCFERKILSLRLKDLQFCDEIEHSEQDFMVTKDIVFLKGGSASIYGVWCANSGNVSYIREERLHHHHRLSSVIEQPLDFHGPSLLGVTDMCEGFSDRSFLLYVANDLQSHTGIAQLTMFIQVGQMRPTKTFKHTSPIWCCTTNTFTKRMAWGLQNKVIIRDISRFVSSKKVIGNVHSLEFDKCGQLIYCGIHNGEITMLDLRTKTQSLLTKISDIGINETVLLSDERSLLCGGFNGLLCKVDLRKYQKVCDYLGHVSTPRKIPFSFSEPNNLLCATGSDNVTRFWNLNGGEPIKYLKPVVEGSPCRAWLVDDGIKCLVYLLQNGKTYVYKL